MRNTNNRKPSRTTLLVAPPALMLALATVASLGVGLRSAARRAVGLMPEIVCTAERSLNTVDEIVVRAPRPERLVSVVARLSGINK